MRSLHIKILHYERACVSVYGVFAIEFIQTGLNAVLVCHWYAGAAKAVGMGLQSHRKNLIPPKNFLIPPKNNPALPDVPPAVYPL